MPSEWPPWDNQFQIALPSKSSQIHGPWICEAWRCSQGRTVHQPEAVWGLKAQLLFGVLVVILKLKHLSFLKGRLLRWWLLLVQFRRMSSRWSCSWSCHCCHPLRSKRSSGRMIHFQAGPMNMNHLWIIVMLLKLVPSSFVWCRVFYLNCELLLVSTGLGCHRFKHFFKAVSHVISNQYQSAIHNT